jgi:hypothetical protein
MIDPDELERLRAEAAYPQKLVAESVNKKHSWIWRLRTEGHSIIADDIRKVDARYLAALVNAAPELIRLARERLAIAAHDEAERRAGR